MYSFLHTYSCIGVTVLLKSVASDILSVLEFSWPLSFQLQLLCQSSFLLGLITWIVILFIVSHISPMVFNVSFYLFLQLLKPI